MKLRNVSYLEINYIHEYNPPYPQSTFTHNPGMTNFTLSNHTNTRRKQKYLEKEL